MIELRDILERLLQRRDLGEAEAGELLVALTDASVAPAMSGALLAALRSKGITPDEVRGFAGAMRSLARRPQLPPGPPAIDIVGTGGDASGSFNLSTGAALLVAAMGVRVVKHGNRSVSSRSGSADLLEALGLPLPLDERAAGDCLAATGFTFLFAPHYHPAMKEVAPVRRALGVRTVFNLLGPLTNPAEPPFSLIGAYSTDAAKLMAETLAGMPIERVFVIHGEPGWDEATPVGPFELYDVRPGRVQREVRDPQQLELRRCTPADLAGGDAAHNAVGLRAVFDGHDTGPHCDALVLNAALALEVTGAVPDAAAGVAAARESISNGDARRLLERLAAFGAASRQRIADSG
jgi:anthranilate phosphoribosyltransferase